MRCNDPLQVPLTSLTCIAVYMDNSSLELYHGRLDKRPNSITLRIRCGLFASVLLFHCHFPAAVCTGWAQAARRPNSITLRIRRAPPLLHCSLPGSWLGPLALGLGLACRHRQAGGHCIL